MTVYGIIDEPTEEEKAAYEAHVATIAASSTRVLQPELACWVLNLLAREHNRTIDSLLYTAEVVKALREYFTTVDADNVGNVLQLLSSVLQSISKLSHASSELLEEVLAMRAAILEAATELFKADTKNGSSPQNASRQLQQLVQVLIIADSTILAVESHFTPALTSSAASPRKARVANLPHGVASLGGTEADPDVNLNDIDGKGLLRWMPLASAANMETANARRLVRRMPVSEAGSEDSGVYSSALSKYGFEDGLRIWDVVVTHFTAGEPIVGIAKLPFSPDALVGSLSHEFGIGWGGQQLYVMGLEPVAFGPKVSPGDVVTVALDLAAGTVAFHRNKALVGIAVGPEGSGAVVEMSLGLGPFYPAVSLCTAGDAVEFVEGPLSNCGGETKADTRLLDIDLEVRNCTIFC